MLWLWSEFFWWLVMLNIFLCACWHFSFLFENNVYSGLVPIFNHLVYFFFWYLSCMSCSCTLDINLLLVISFTNIFSHSAYFLFIVLMVSFTVQKLLSLMRSHLFIFAFVSFTLGVNSKKNIAMIYVKTVLPGSGFIISKKLSNFQFNKRSYNKCLFKS